MKRSTVKITKRVVDSLKYDAVEESTDNGKRISPRVAIWDSELKGFGVRVYPSGKKSFLYSYRINGRKRSYQIGDYRTYTVDMARKEALKLAASVITGEDPVEAKKEYINGSTIADLCENYKVRHASNKKTGSEDMRRIKKHILPLWGSTRVDAIKRADIAALHNRIGKNSPYEANRILALLRKMFGLAKIWGFLSDTASNPAEGIQKFREMKRDRWVKHEEFHWLAKAINEESNIFIKAVFWLYLYTGARKSELLTAKWADVDFVDGTLRLADSKAGRIHYVHLNKPAIEILKGLPRFNNNPYVFPGTKEGQHLVNVSKAWKRICESATKHLWMNDPKTSETIASLKANGKPDTMLSCEEIRESINIDLPVGFTDIRLHDLRRTVGSWLAMSGASLHLIGKILGHSNPSTSAIYSHFTENPAKEAMEEHGRQILEAVNGIRLVR